MTTTEFNKAVIDPNGLTHNFGVALRIAYRMDLDGVVSSIPGLGVQNVANNDLTAENTYGAPFMA